MRSMSAGRYVAHQLERGAFQGPLASVLSRIWARRADPARPVRLPAGRSIIGVGGAVLGGSGKTPVALELARALARSGLKTALVARGYRGRLRRAQRVLPDARAVEFGDEAVMLASCLRGSGVGVYAGGDWNDAIALAARDATLVVADGLLQARPTPLSCSILVLDAEHPWGSRRCPPQGDLRALSARLLSAADVILVGGAACVAPAPWLAPHRHAFAWSSRLVGARTATGELISLRMLSGMRLGLALALARPERIERQLRASGVQPVAVRLCADHAVPTLGLPGFCPKARERGAGVAAWLTSPKCSTKLGAELAGAPVWVLEQEVVLPTELLEICMSLPANSHTLSWPSSPPLVIESAPCSSGQS